MRDGDLSAVGKARFEACARLTLDDDDFVAGLCRYQALATPTRPAPRTMTFKRGYSPRVRAMRTTSGISRRPRMMRARWARLPT